jgi:DNA-binding transcriptional ArsR family regulator
MKQDDAVRALGALAHASRLAIFRRLVRAGARGCSAGELARASGVSAASLTFHIKELERAGLTESWREGRHVRSRLCVAAMRDLVMFLTEECCGGRPELCGEAVEPAVIRRMSNEVILNKKVRERDHE